MNEKPTEEIKKLPIITKFCMTIGELPTSYLMSLTYLEQVTWLCNFLEKTMIPALNQNANAVEELQSLFELLRTYVNDYFDNLDVQEEINNKLDEMAESGQLTDIIAQYLGLAGMITFDTIADMKQATNLVNGSKCHTLGYSSINDGGDSIYKIRTITNEDIVNESTIISLNNPNLIAELITNEINPETFVGNNDEEKLQNAINYATNLYNNEQIPVSIILNRLFTITNSLIINKNNLRIPFTFTTNSNGGFKKTTSGDLFITNENYISDLTFNNICFKSINESGIIILQSPKFINIKFINCNFKDIDTAVKSESYLQSITFEGCTITGGQNHFIDTYATYYLNFINNIVEHRINSYLLYQRYTATTYNRLYYCNFENNLIEGFRGSNSGFIHIAGIELLNIINNYFESLQNVLVLENHFNSGVINIKNNRLFQSPSLIENLNQKGMLFINLVNNTLFNANINFVGNKISNTYAIYFNAEKIYATSGNVHYKINFHENEISNTFTGEYLYDLITTNQPFNILPMYSIDNSPSIYSRDLIVNTDKPITWNKTITINDKEYNNYYKLRNNSLFVNNLSYEQAQTTPTAFNIYYGIDIYMDDMISLYMATTNMNILNYYRSGSPNEKHITGTFIHDNNAGYGNILSNIEIIGIRG